MRDQVAIYLGAALGGSVADDLDHHIVGDDSGAVRGEVADGAVKVMRKRSAVSASS